MVREEPPRQLPQQQQEEEVKGMGWATALVVGAPGGRRPGRGTYECAVTRASEVPGWPSSAAPALAWALAAGAASCCTTMAKGLFSETPESGVLSRQSVRRVSTTQCDVPPTPPTFSFSLQFAVWF